MTVILALLRPFLPYIIGAVALVGWTYGNRWHAVQAYKHKAEIATAAEQAKITESHRRDEILSANAKATYERDLQNIRIDSKRLDAVLERLHNTASATCRARDAPADTAGATRTTTPQFEWGG